MPDEVFSDFPDDGGADDFVREYPLAIAPAQTEHLSLRMPVFLLQVPGDPAGPDAVSVHQARVKRVVMALRESHEGQGEKLVPYALVHPTSDDDLVGEAAARDLAFGVPPRMTPDRFRDAALMQDLVTAVKAHAAGAPGDGAAGGSAPADGPSQVTAATAADSPSNLRDYAYQGRVARGGVAKTLWSLGGKGSPDGAGLGGWLLRTFWLSMLHTLPRWWWARRVTRRLIRRPRQRAQGRRGWLGRELNVTGGREDLFQVMVDVATRQTSRLRLPAGHRQREEGTAVLEQLLTLALLADLAQPLVGSLLPKRRRRTARPVLLLQVPHPDEPGARTVERFLRVYAQAQAQAPTPGPLVIAVGSFSTALLDELGPETMGFTQASKVLRQGGEKPVLVTFHAEPFGRPGLPIRKPTARRFRSGWRSQTVLATSLPVLLIAALIVEFPLRADDSDTSCVAGGSTPPGRALHGEVHPVEWYRSAKQAVETENRRAEALAARGRPVRTVVYFTSEGPQSNAGTLFDGIVPELRGIALWQRRLNSEALSDDSRVPLRVEVRSTGRGFVRAPEEAKKLADEVRSGSRTGAREISGVLGFAQSRDSTLKALRILAEARIPAVGTTATADEMQVGDYYWPTTPVNSTEARVVASLARNKRLVARSDGAGCSTAQQAIVVQSSADLYSRSIAEQFMSNFTSNTGTDVPDGTVKLVNFSQEGDFGAGDPGAATFTRPRDLANRVCESLESQSRTVVYWAGRTRDFAAFVDALDARDACGREAVTVLAGNELTNVAQTGEFEGRGWLRLYYAAHRLPDADTRISRQTAQFVNAYNDFVAREHGEDPWHDDGQAAVAYDALHVLSQAVDLARADNSVGMGAVTTALKAGVAFDGATGWVEYTPGSNAPPKDKTLAVLRLTPKGPRTAVVCGAYVKGGRYATQGTPCFP